jgi:hypothetical protein
MGMGTSVFKVPAAPLSPEDGSSDIHQNTAISRSSEMWMGTHVFKVPAAFLSSLKMEAARSIETLIYIY